MRRGGVRSRTGLSFFGTLVRGPVTLETRRRLALGAQSSDIRKLVLKWSLSMAAGGIVVGAIGALGVTRLMGGLLFGVDATDALTFGVVSVVMAAAAVVASLFPAVRATRVDPIKVLNAE